MRCVVMKAKLNPDTLFVQNLRKRIKQNNGYCPCKLLKTPDTKCPCKDFREGNGCDCGLYLSEKEGASEC